MAHLGLFLSMPSFLSFFLSLSLLHSGVCLFFFGLGCAERTSLIRSFTEGNSRCSDSHVHQVHTAGLRYEPPVGVDAHTRTHTHPYQPKATIRGWEGNENGDEIDSESVDCQDIKRFCVVVLILTCHYRSL